MSDQMPEQPQETVPEVVQEVEAETPRQPAPTEKEAQTAEPMIPQSEIETAAKAQGWSPDGGELGALEFLQNGRVFRDRMSDEIKTLRNEQASMYGVVAEHLSRQDQQAYSAQRGSYEQQIDAAVESGDVEKVRQLRSQVPPPPPAVPRPDPNLAYIDQWRKTNTWFDSDQRMKDIALGFYQSEKLKSGTENPQAILPIVEQMVREAFPDKFQAPSNPNAGRGAGAETGGKVTRGGKKGLSRSDLTEAEAAHIDDFVKMGMDETKLIASVVKGRSQRGQ